MWSQRTILGVIIGVTCAGAASAQTSGALRFRAGQEAVGLQVGQLDFRLNLQVDHAAPSVMDHAITRGDSQGLNIKFVGKTAAMPGLGFFGRLGRTPAPAARWAIDNNAAAASYGVGVSWDFSPRASAVLGWDTYDVRSAAGDRDVRATSLGLQWRY